MNENWEFDGGESKPGLLGLLGTIQSLQGMTVGDASQYYVLDSEHGISAWYGDRGNGTVEMLAEIDVSGTSYGSGVAIFGSLNTVTLNGVIGLSKNGDGVFGKSTNHHGVHGESTYLNGVYGKSTGLFAAGYFEATGSHGIEARTTSPSGYGVFTTSIYSIGNISGQSFTDRTKHFEGNALSEIRKIKGKDGNIDHSTLPKFARYGEEERDLGAMISILTVAIQQIDDRLDRAKI